MLIGLKAAERFIRIAFKVIEAGEQPIGVILVAPPGSGKSYLLTSFTGDSWVVCSDISGHGLETLMYEMSSRANGYLVVPDLIRAFGRQNAKKSLFAVLNLILEEGIVSIRRSDLRLTFPQPVKFGFIGAITPEEFRHCIKDLESIGLLSRCLIFSFKYTKEDEARIEEYVSRNGMPTVDQKILLNLEKINPVVIPEELTKLVRKLGNFLKVKKKEHFAFRAIKIIRRLLKGNASLMGRNYVSYEDFVIVYSLLPFLIDRATDLDYRILKLIGRETILNNKPITYDDIMNKFSNEYSEETVNNQLTYLKLRGLITIKNNLVMYTKLRPGGEYVEEMSEDDYLDTEGE